MVENFRSIAVAVVVLLLTASLARADYDPDKIKTSAVGVFDQTLHDKDRDRDVPVKIYYPRNVTDKSPVILFSHGLGGSNEEYQYLGWYWAGRGYVSVHLDHHGSDTVAILAGGLAKIGETGGKIARDPQNAVNRVKDVSFVIDQLTTLNADDKWKLHGRLDLDRIGMAGHSFGGNTTLAVAGQTFGALAPENVKFSDARIKCGIAISPPMVVPAEKYEQSLAAITIPMMIVSGTDDNFPIADDANLQRVAAFKFLTHAPADLVVFTGADHFTFVGTRFGRDKKPGDDRDHKLTQQATEAFFDTYLKNDAAAKKWLENGGFTAAAGKDAELKHLPE